MIVDANILIYATNERASSHARAKIWLAAQLDGESRVGLPWPSLMAFMRLSTSLRMTTSPISSRQAWGVVQTGLGSPVAWIPSTTQRHVQIFGSLVEKYEVTGNLVPDAHLAAYAIEHNVPLVSADTDFARFTELRWVNPLVD